MPKFHRDSIFGDGPRKRLDREQLAQFKAKLRLQRRPGRVTGATRDVGEALAAMLGADGRLDPTIDTLAKRAGVKRSAVREALKRLRAFGFLTWARRLVRNQAGGWRCSQTSNAYVLLVPACESGFRPRVLKKDICYLPSPAPRRQEEAFQAMVEEAARLPDLLMARQIAFAARQRATMAG